MSTPAQPGTFASRRVDIHCHCLSGVDDGPGSLEEAVGLCRMLVLDGFTDVIATPHQLGRYEGANTAAALRSAVRELQDILDQRHVPLRLHPGGEVRVDERIPALLRDDVILTLADQRHFLLLELSFSSYIEPAGLLAYLSETKLDIILAHAERYSTLQRDPGLAKAWIEGGAAIQLNADSLLGTAGTGAANVAWQWLADGWVSLVATDAHNTTSRRPRMSDAMELISKRVGEDLARRVCIENPLCVLEGRQIG